VSGAERADELSPVKRALLELRELKARLAESEGRQRQPIAVVGLGLRFPGGADSPAAFWRLLREGRQAVSEVPPDRWDIEAFYDPDPETPGRMYARHGGFLERADVFDPHVFGISPREAAVMDPQQRLLLEVAWQTLEDAGVAPDRLAESATGVYVGIAGSDYARLVFGDVRAVDVYAASGTAFSVAAGRVSYVFGLQGPSLAVDTACSSSLVAVHLACQALRSGECRLALAGGVNLILLPEIHVNFCRARMLARDGRCKTFDAEADGYVRGEGCGMVALKRLADAKADGDRILAVIRGSAVNQDGRSGGLTAPNGPSQEAVIRAALESAGLEPADLDFVEAHGTGTPLGDPIEAQALGAVLGRGRARERPLLIGSVKTNLGHLEAAAGIAGLIKVVLALQHGEIPPHLNLKRLSPHMDWDTLALKVATDLTPWAAGPRRRVAGVSSFGFSGTNAHVLVEEPPPLEVPLPGIDRPYHLLTLSARTETALAASARRLVEHLATNPGASLGDLASSANTGRAQLPRRLGLVANDVAQASAALQDWLSDAGSPAVFRGTAGARPPEVVFFFTGSGAQYPGMGRQLFDTSPTFRRTLEACDEILRDRLPLPLLSVMYPAPGARSPLDDATYTQPALFALEFALSELWRSCGVEPSAVLGHSTGELVAACVAGVFSLEDGLRLIAERGRLMQELPPLGGMAAIFADEAAVAAAIAPHPDALWIAAVNAADNVVVSGAEEQLTALLAGFEARGVKGKRLAISNAYHSPLVEPMLEALERAAGAVAHRDPTVDLISNLTGRAVRPGELGPAYWRRHVREAVRFHASVRALADQGHAVFLEIGPHPALLGMAQGTLGAEALCLPSLRRDGEDWRVLLESFAALYARGARIEWSGLDRDYARRKLALPTYAFDHERYWIDNRPPPPPSKETAWVAAARSGREQSRQGPLDLAIGSFPAKWALLERLTTAYEVRALAKLGAFAAAGERATLEDLRRRLGISETYRHLLGRWLAKLAAEGVLRAEGEEYRAERALPEPPLAALLAEAEAAFADYPELLGYVRRCGDRLDRVLTGRESPLETLFPGGSFEEAEALYQYSCVSRYMNGIVRAVVEAASRARPAGLAVLEIGAGTGGTTSALLPALPAERTRYVFTDLSDLFLARAQEKFREHPFVRYSILDIERDPAEQGYPAGAFDVVVAANVLHATRDLRRTVDRARSLLAPGGLLVLSETTRHPHYFDITTGLIEGWQSFEDDLRADNPLIGAEGWCALLRERGFEAALALPEPGTPSEVLGTHVIVAALAEGGEAVRGAISLPAATAAVPVVADEAAAARARQREQIVLAMPGERRDLLAALVRREVMKVLRLDAQHPPDLQARLLDLGLDSLMAVQLRNQLAAGLALGRPLSATLVFDHPTCEAIAAYLDREFFDGAASGAPAAPAASGVAPPAPADARAERLEEMTDEETEALLLKRLQTIEERRS
jgi:acyl transferase domain-containing protein/SAM-dependent methyltransferase